MPNDRLIVFDTETTALIPGQICQIAYLILEQGGITGKNFFFAVDEMNPASQQIHGFSMAQLEILSGGARFASRAREIHADFAAARLIAAHNAAFDKRFLQAEFRRLDMDLPAAPSFCTMKYFTKIVGLPPHQKNGRSKPPRLGELMAFYRLPPDLVADRARIWFGCGDAPHDARFDTAAVWLCMEKAMAAGDLQGI